MEPRKAEARATGEPAAGGAPHDLAGDGEDDLLHHHSVEEAVYLGTRVLVMSPRPGRIIVNQASPFSRMETSVREARVLPEFIEMEKRVSESIYAGH